MEYSSVAKLKLSTPSEYNPTSGSRASLMRGRWCCVPYHFLQKRDDCSLGVGVAPAFREHVERSAIFVPRKSSGSRMID